MFGLIVSGRLVQTNFEQVPTDLTKFITTIENADEINHIVLFLTGTEPFPLGFGGQIYFSWPDPSNNIHWHLLGYISNEKPSAIFKISNLKKSNVNQEKEQPAFPQFPQLQNLQMGSTMSKSAQVGISVESMDIILQSTPANLTGPTNLSSYNEFTQKMLENFYNYVTSFGDQNNISMNLVTNWYNGFRGRLEKEPNFWK